MPETLEIAFGLTAPQTAIWLDQAFHPGKPIYNTGQTVAISGNLDPDLFVEALRHLARETDALRLGIRMDGDAVRQSLRTDAELPIDCVDFVSAPDPTAAAVRWIEDEFWRPIGWSDFPLFRFAVLRLGSRRHVWFQKYHHLIVDATARRLITSRAARIYEALQGGSVPPAAPGARFAEIITAEAAYLRSAAYGADRKYWLDRFAALPEPLFNSARRQSERARSGRPARLASKIERSVFERLGRLARSRGTTSFKAIVALVHIAFSRHYGRSDIVFGVPLANRTTAAFRATIGLFAQIMPFRIDIPRHTTLAEAVTLIDAMLAEDLAHRRFPFYALGRELNLARKRRNGLYDVSINFLATDYGFNIAGAPIDVANLSSGFFTRWAITIADLGPANGVDLIIDYDPGLVEAEEAAELARSLRFLLEKGLDHLALPVARVPIMAPPDGERLLAEAASTAVELPLDATTLAQQCKAQAAQTPDAIAALCASDERRLGSAHVRDLPPIATIHGWFEAQAARTPNAPAIQYEGAQITYAALNARANLLARRLTRSGVGPEVLVGLCLDRSLDMVVGILGILKAGGAYLPLDPDNPPSRTHFILEDAKPRVIVTQTSLQDRLPSGEAEAVYLDIVDWEQQDGRQNPPSAVVAENLAYVIYTSGSTGQPKGTLVTHHNVVRLFHTTEPWFGFGPDDVWTVFHSFAFDFSVWEVWGALLYGGKAVIVSGPVARSPETFRALLAKERVTVLCQTPSAFYPLINIEGTAASYPRLTLRFVIFGGEALEFRRLKPWFKHHGDRPKLINMYGITETTVHATYYAIAKDALGSESTIGVPLPDLQIHLLDENRVAVPPGTMGEIYVGGPGVARGYLNRPDLTAERFILDPFSTEPGARLYKSGDRARARPDGQLEFRGRADDQIKLRGYRIELGEIEAALTRRPDVIQSTVVLHDGPSDEKELVAYVIAERGATPSPSRLRADLCETLPAYMLPSAFIVLQSWPLTHNGKLDRAALPAPRREHRVGLAAVAPRTETEARVAAVWAEALATDQVGIFDDYFELGGHSLMAARVCARLRNAFDVPLAITDIFSAHTAATLADTIDAMSRHRIAGARQAPQRTSRDRNLPTSFPQDSSLFFHALAPGNLAYNNQVLIHLRGDLDVVALERTLGEIVRRHEALRTTFACEDGEWRQVIHSPFPIVLPIVAAAPGHPRSLFEHHFDPAKLPLIQWTLLRIGPREHVLVHVEHHLIHDGWSFGVFVQELMALYTAYRTGRASPLAELPIQFADFAQWQRNLLQGDALNRLLSYWKGQLAGPLPVLALLTDRARPSIQTFRGDEVQADLPPRLAVAIRAFGHTHGCSLFSVMLAGFLALLRRYSGQDDIIVAAGYANREHKEIEALIGMIVNMLPLRVNLTGDPTFAELVVRVQAVVRDALAHQALPFNVIVRSLDLPHDASRNPLCQVAFSFHDSPVPALRLPGVTGEISYPHNGSAKFDMNVIVIPHGEQQAGAPVALRDERITIKWDCNTDLFDLTTIERMLERYVGVLEAGTGEPQVRLSDIVTLDAAERRHLVEWNNTASDYPREQNVPALFEEQVARSPTATALVFGTVTLTYGELNQRANRLAHYLRRHGVGPEVKVGLCVERSIEMVVAILGILKAGGAYVPLDPDYPRSRLEFMLRDTAAPVLVTQPHLRDLLPSFDGRVVCIDTEWDAIARESVADPVEGVTAENLAYVIYTSGSTGTPKGVCVEHRSVVRLVKNTNYVALGPDEIFLQFAPISFDASTFELWGSLLNGARLAIFPPGMPSLKTLAETIRAYGVSTLWLTAALFHQMVDFEIETLTGVRQILAGGEALSVAHVRRMLDALPLGHRLINGYGPTENTTFTCCYVMTRASVIDRSVPIGKPIANTLAYILDEGQRPVPDGVPGELYIGGDGLARHYLNQPSLTAERFVVVDGRRLYRSGDMARRLADGSIEFVGRTDDQVKLRGYRIEPGEIEATLNRHPTVRECVVLLRAAHASEKRLVAYVVGKDGAPATPDLLRYFLRAELPAYMVPSDYVTMDSLPLTPIGKIDRNSLPLPPALPATPPNISVKPRTPTEQIVAEIWATHLGHANFGIEDDFFEVGGHSLVAAAIFAEIGKRCGVALPLALLFETPTIASLATAIADGNERGRSGDLIPVQPAGSKPPIFAMLGIGGNYVAYATLSKALGDDQPFYSLEMPGLEGENISFQRIEDIVAQFREEMRAVRAGEPCVLIGACAGALVVFELARRLTAEGRAVDLVIMLDPPATGAKRSRRFRSHWLWRHLVLPRFLLSRLWLHLHTMTTLKGTGRRAFLKEKLSVVLEILSKRDLFRASRREIQVTRILEATSAALSTFVPQPYGGRVALLLGDRYAPDGERDPSSDWRTLCTGSFDVAWIPGEDTGAMLRPPNVQVLVARLKALLHKG